MPKKRTPRQLRRAQARARTCRQRQADAQAFQAKRDRLATELRQLGAPSSAAWVAPGLIGRRWECRPPDEAPDDDDWDGSDCEECEAEQRRMATAEKVLSDTVVAILKVRSVGPAHRLDEVLAEHDDGGEELESAATIVLLAWLFTVQLWFGPDRGRDVAIAAVAWVREHLGAEEVDDVMPFARWIGDPESRPSYDSPPDELVAALLPGSVPLFAGLAATAGGGDPGWLDRLDLMQRGSIESE